LAKKSLPCTLLLAVILGVKKKKKSRAQPQQSKAKKIISGEGPLPMTKKYGIEDTEGPNDT